MEIDCQRYAVVANIKLDIHISIASPIVAVRGVADRIHFYYRMYSSTTSEK
jgi:hypothetical protein